MKRYQAETPLLDRAPRPRRGGELGLTLTELLVVIAILAIIGGSLAGAFGIGLRLLSPTGAQATLTGNADLLAFEQQIGADVTRADCLAAPGMLSIPTGGCRRSVPSTPLCALTSTFLCLAWYVPGSACHVVAYWQQSDGAVVRSDLTANTNTTTRIATGGLTVSASWPRDEVTSNGGYIWTSQVTIAVAQHGISGAPSATQPVETTFRLVPLAADPLSAALPGGTSPC